MSEKTKDIPILMKPEMSRATRADLKTQTRRLMKQQPPEWAKRFKPRNDGTWVAYQESCGVTVGKCPYGQPGDRLWVRETHWRWGYWGIQNDKLRFVYLDDGEHPLVFDEPHGLLASDRAHLGYHKRPSIFMPRWASRITLLVKSVRVERLQDISEADAIKEGCPAVSLHDLDGDSTPPSYYFKRLWDSINGKRKGCAWDDNPWVWAIEFERIDV